MKKMKFLLAVLLCLAAFGLAACGGNPSLTTKHSFSINRNEIVMDAGDTFVLVAVCGDATVAYETDDASVAAVDEDGKITAVSAGETFITAKADEETLACKVTVQDPEYAVLFIDKEEQITAAQDAVVEITAVLTRDGMEKQTEFSWSVTNPSDCDLQTDGNSVLFKSDKAGEYVITAACDKAAAAITVTVLDR